LTESEVEGYGLNTLLEWNANEDRMVYLRARHLDGRVIGNGVTYMVIVLDFAYAIYLPTISK
jgi:hypothetical protein